jgi:diguanylate cyclase (GGDEF)-like protein
MRTVLLLLTLAVAYLVSDCQVKRHYHRTLDEQLVDVEQRFTPASQMTNMEAVKEFLKVSQAHFPDLVYGIVLDQSNKPLLLTHIATPEIKDYLFQVPQISKYLQDLLQHPTLFFEVQTERFFKHPEFGTFFIKPLQINKYRFVLVFLEKSLAKRIFLLRVGMAVLALFLFLLLIYVWKKGKPSRSSRQDENRKKTANQMKYPEKRDPARELFEEKKMLEREVEQLSFFREIALAVNSTADFDSMLKGLLGILSAKYTEMNIIVYLNSEDGQDVLFTPVYGLLRNEIRAKEYLVAVGYKEYVEEDFEAWAVSGSVEGQTVVPLKDGDLLFGGILFERLPGSGPGPDVHDAHFLSSQLTLAIKNSYLHSLAITDGLSGLYVHRYFQIKLEEEMRRAQRYGKPFSILLMDVDHFKAVNDTYGHPAGDYVIKTVSALVRKTIRKTDLAFRYGGDEIVILMPETPEPDAIVVAEKLRNLIFEFPFQTGDKEFRLTSSMGVATWRREWGKEEIVKRCDMALYRAKEEGRNRVVRAEE